MCTAILYPPATFSPLSPTTSSTSVHPVNQFSNQWCTVAQQQRHVWMLVGSPGKRIAAVRHGLGMGEVAAGHRSRQDPGSLTTTGSQAAQDKNQKASAGCSNSQRRVL